MDDQFNFDRVRDLVERRMYTLGFTNSELARQAKVDRSQIAKLLSGQPWTMRPATLGRIESALDLPGGTIEAVGQSQVAVESATSVLSAIESDPTLSPMHRKALAALYLSLSSGAES